MLIREKKKWEDKGFLGAAKKTTKAPYYQCERTPDMYPLGKESNFITPESADERAKSPKGMKR